MILTETKALPCGYMDVVYEMEIYGPIDPPKLFLTWSNAFQKEFGGISPDIKLWCADELKKNFFQESGIYRFSFKKRERISQELIFSSDAFACTCKKKSTAKWFSAGITGLMLAWFEVDRARMKGFKICSPYSHTKTLPAIDFTLKKPLFRIIEPHAGFCEGYDLRFSKM